jgi:hypothetical protein
MLSASTEERACSSCGHKRGEDASGVMLRLATIGRQVRARQAKEPDPISSSQNLKLGTQQGMTQKGAGCAKTW